LIEHFLEAQVWPSVVHSDNAPEFVAGLVAKVNDLMGMRGVSGSPWKPLTQGAVERRNLTNGRILSMMAHSHKDNWDKNLKFVDYAVNTHVFSGKGVTPNYYVTGFEAVGPFELQMGLADKVVAEMKGRDLEQGLF
jgi:hypothetical protein